jgi:flagellin-like protein
MRSHLRVSRRGLSEIVGALMLVLIVVVATTAFSAFVLSYQKHLQAQQNITQQRNLEVVRVISVATELLAPAPTPNELFFLNISSASLSVNPSNITEIAINGNPLENYTVWTRDPNSGTYQSAAYVAGQTLPISAREQFSIAADVSPVGAGNVPPAPNPESSFYIKTLALFSNQFIKVELYTLLENDFTRTFVPPTALGTIGQTQIYNGMTFVTVLELDGTGSIQTGNDTIVSWSWTVTDTGNLTTASASGEKAIWPFAPGPPTGTTYTVRLTVVNTDGLIGSSQFAYVY